MLLQHILEKLDEELGRLQRLREIVAGLGRRAVPVAAVAAVEEPSYAEPDAVPVRVKRVRRSFRRESGPRQRARVTEKPQTAFTSAIPAGPVVVSADALARESAARKQARTVEPKAVEGTLGAMIRALGQPDAV